ncbi:MAG: J domain-containing protein [Lachnospiraceae bacterium]|nr:J domain-containing protein [Lachnospiraceae bacterium]
MDPYQVLGISPSASDDEVKKAYRSLSRKYHPDANVNNPNKAMAEEKFKQVQQAYDTIMKMRQRGESYGGYGSNYSSGRTSYGYGQRANISPELQAALNYLSGGYYQEAMTVLSSIDASKRGGVWYYMAAVASEGLGNLSAAREYAARAVALEPSNFQFRQYQAHLDGDAWYATRSASYRRPYDGYSRWCVDLLLMNLFCGCCC